MNYKNFKNEYHTENLDLYQMDCMELLKQTPDNYYDLAITDPPYGINMDSNNIGGVKLAKVKDYGKKDWDSKPPEREYFEELKRVSKNQIIFGANHFIENIPNANSSCWIVWDKLNTGDFADCEMVYTSFKTAVRKFTFMWNGMLQGNMKEKEIRIHQCQKPAALYNWILQNYAKIGDSILDTHLGGASIAKSCENGVLIDNKTTSFHLTACELDGEYFEKSVDRIKAETQQQSLF